jgi:protein-S-isoprenylcysteine O-methyltransferase Ste14
MLFQRLENQGDWLFRWRSYAPLGLIPVVIFLFAFERSVIIDRPDGAWWTNVCLGIALGGFAMRFVIAGYVPVGTSGRNTKSQVARTLNTTGMYSIMRNPLYFANFLIFLGWLCWFANPLFLLFAVSAYALYYERIIMAEERFLAKTYGETYRRWAAETSAFFPNVTRWRRPELPYSFRSACRREYHTQFLIISVFIVLEGAYALALREQPVTLTIRSSLGLVSLFAASALLYLAGRFLKKRTGILTVEGR